MLSEEEKKAIEYLKNNSREGATFWCYEAIPYFVIILNLIENQQKELNSLKEIEQLHQEENGLLRQELDMQIEHNKELEATLKQTQDSWFEDTQKLQKEKEKNKELEAKRIWNKGRIEELKNELVQEKEKNNALEKYQKLYLDGELITAKQGKFFEKMIKENYISKDKIREIVIPTPDNAISLEIQQSEFYAKILKVLEEK